MPYITTEAVKKKRETLKREFPKVKFSVTREHGSSIRVVILEAPFDIKKDKEDVNYYYIKEHYKDSPEVMKFLLRVKEIIDEGNYTEVYDGDYGAVPSFYIHIEFGRWDRPYKKVIK
jgi:uncharacterized protein (DUF608 family)